MRHIFKTQFKSLPKTITKRIASEFNLEEQYFKIKNGKNIQDFSDFIVNLTDELAQNNSKEKDNSEYGDVFVALIYKAISQCFQFDYSKKIAIDIKGSASQLDKHNHWKCSNCSNCNFNNYINKKMNYDLQVCSLCGIKQIDSIVLKLRDHDTYIMVNDVKNIHTKDDEQKHDEIDKTIKRTQEQESFNLLCPNRNDKKQCPAILRLAKNLIYYNKWIKAVYTKSNGTVGVNTTMNADIGGFLANNNTHSILKQIFIDSLKLIDRVTEKDTLSLTQMINDNEESILDPDHFLQRKKFAKSIQKHTKIKPAVSVKLHKLILQTLKEKAQMAQFGKFLSELNLKTIDKDYHHILHSHINKGNKITIENVFRFFTKVVHYEDSDQEIKECKVFNRREQTIKWFNAQNNLSAELKDYINNNSKEDKNIWSLKQYYVQTTMDIIHSYLVHCDWKGFIRRYLHTDIDINDEMKELEKSTNIKFTAKLNLSIVNNQQKQNKYVTESSGAMNYGFGIDHSHPYLSPRYLCLRDEILCNSLCALSPIQYEHLLIKAINMHQVALDEYKKELICKYFNLEYNILRNEPIGLRHIAAVIIYTDMSNFCTAFRKTYRKIDDNETEYEVTQRHIELYFYARYLYESVEFYGQEMNPKMTVYHGLNRVMNFSRFTAFFNQPISCSKSLKTAQEFSRGVGIILTLKCGSEDFNNTAKIPKSLSVSFLSSFPQEDEKLFYGAHIRFRISNIIEATTNKSHSKELKMFNKFQKTVRNGEIKWDENEKQTNKMIDGLVILIKYQINRNECKHSNNNEYKQQQGDKTETYITSYGKELFNYFCNNINTSSVWINNYKSLPMRLYHALFVDDESKHHISLIPISQLFTHLQEVRLTQLNIRQLTEESKMYIDAVIHYLNNSDQTLLQKITIQSKSQRTSKENATIQNITKQYFNVFNKFGWNIQYELEYDNTHNLKFIKNQQKDKDNDNKQMDNDNDNNNKQDDNHNDNDIKPKKEKISKLEQFINTTNADISIAALFLNATNFAINKAVHLYQTSDVSRLLPVIDNIIQRQISKTNVEKNNKTNQQIDEQKQEEKWNETQTYFMQIVAIQQDTIHVYLVCDSINHKQDRKFRINDKNNVSQRIVIPKKRNSAGVEIHIDEKHDALYDLALYDIKNTDHPVPKSNQIKLIILKDKNDYPPLNKSYKPNCVDLETLFKVKDEKNNEINIYWSVPLKPYGNITYKIIKENIQYDDEIKEEDEIIDLLPYSVPLTSIPISFKVITITTVDGRKYESDASGTINIDLN
eukprot:280063_1